MKRIVYSTVAVLTCGFALIVSVHFFSGFSASADSPDAYTLPNVQTAAAGKTIDIPQNADDFLDWQLTGADQPLAKTTETAILDEIGQRGGAFWTPDKVTAIYYGLGDKGRTLKDGTYLGPTDLKLSDGEVVSKLQGRPTMVIFYQPTSSEFDWSAMIVDVQSHETIETIHHNRTN